MLKRYLVHIFLSLLPVLSIAQTIEQTLLYADRQFEQNNFDLAIQNYRRIIFFDINKYGKDVSQNLAESYLQVGDYKNAGYYLDLAYSFSVDESVKNELIFKKSANYIFTAQYDFALLEILNLSDTLPDYFYKKKEFYLGVIKFQLEDYQASESHFLNSLDTSFHEKRQNISALFHQNERLDKWYNPNLVRIMSLIIPGAGQFYCGDIKNGINSLLLTFSFGLLFQYVAFTYTLLDAVLSVMPWYQRYYLGGVNSAYAIAIQKINDKRTLIYHDILEEVASSGNK